MSRGWSDLDGDARPLDLRARRDLVRQHRPDRVDGAWIVADPWSGQYYELPEEEGFLLGLLDGRRSLQEIRRAFAERFAPRRVTSGQLLAFLSALHAEGLVVADAAGQGRVLSRRARDERRRAWLAAVANPLAIRGPGVDPTPLLRWLAPCGAWLFHRGTLLALGLVLAAGTLVVATHTAELWEQGRTLVARLTPARAAGLAAIVLGTKLVHELAHALVSVRLGGRVREAGVLFLCGLPALYCDVSSNWMFRERWRRVAVAAAGIAAELVLAAAAAVLWWASAPGPFHDACFYLLAVGSLGTLLVNGNPLLRYDGYFIASDVLDISNLGERASEALRRGVVRGLGGPVDGPAPRESARRRVLLAVYAAAAIAYRVALGLTIYLVARSWLEPRGLAIAADALGLALVVGGAVAVNGPVRQTVRELRSARDGRGPAPWRLALAAAALIGALALPWPARVTAPGAVELAEGRTAYVTVAGQVVESRRYGDAIRAGEVLARLDDPALRRALVRLETDQAVARARLEALRRLAVGEPARAAELPVAEQTLADLDEQLRVRRAELERLAVLAPRAGTLVRPPVDPLEAVDAPAPRRPAPLDAEQRDRYLPVGTPLARVGDPARLEAVAVVEQADVERLRVGQRAWLAARELPGQWWPGQVVEVAELAETAAPPELIAAGLVAPHEADPRPGAQRPVRYRVRVALAPGPAASVGAVGQVRIAVAPASLAERISRWAARTFVFRR